MRTDLARFPTLSLRLVQLGLVIVFLALGIYVSLTSSEGPDEVAHFSFNRFVAQYGRLPLDEAERLEAGYKADLPPLYYLIAGLIGRGLDLESPPHLKLTRDNIRLKLVTGLQNIKGWRLIWTEDPWRGEVLLWYLGRWVSLGGGLLGLALTYGLLRAVWPEYPWLALSAVAILGFLSTYVYISGVAGYESLTGALMAAYFGLLFYTINRPERNWLYLGLGLLLGLAATTRQTVWSVLPILPILVLWLAYRRGWRWWTVLDRLALVGLGLALTFGLWLIYVGLYFNQIAEQGWFWGLVSPVLIGDGSGRTSLQIANLASGGEIGADHFARQSDDFWQWGWYFFTGVWGQGWQGWLMLVVWGLALLGLVWRWRREPESSRLWILLLMAHIGLLLFLPLLRFVFSGSASTAMSQHILFPAGAAMLVLLLLGLRTWLSAGRLTALLLALAGIYLSQTVAVALDRQINRFPIQTVPVAASEQVIAEFENLNLIGYDTRAENGLLQVTLLWRTEASPNEDYQVELTLLNEAGQPESRWVGQPLNGRYPTRAWLPGDRIRDVIDLPIAGLPAGNYVLQLRLLGELNPILSTQGDPMVLGSIALAPASVELDDTLALGQQSIVYTFWHEEQPDDNLPVYGENATIVISTQDVLNDEMQLSLIDPIGQTHKPVDWTGRVYNFRIAPNFPSGEYRLRLEQRRGETLVAQAETPPLLEVKTEARRFDIPSMSQPVSANFAGYVGLLGYDLPQTRLEPGDALPVTLYWQALRTIGADLVLFNHLIGPDGRQWGGQDRRAQDVYSTMLWAPGEIVPDTYRVSLSSDAPPGAYYLLVGLYLSVGEAAVSLPLMENGQMTDVTHVAIGPIEVVATDGQP
jgi:4-amino-4-deoxy-L-arabinose transferase-like glycosyltransferase